MAAKPAAKSPRARKTTEVRNTPVPRKAKPIAAAPVHTVTPEMIARRAYEIYLNNSGGSQLDHWLQAERELTGRR